MALSYFPKNAVLSIIKSFLVPEIIKFFVKHVQKFKCQAKIMSYAKVDCSHLNPVA